MKKKYIIALELSDSQIKGAAASVSTNAHSSLAIPSIEVIAVEEKVNCVQYGRVQNLIDAAEHVNYIIQKLENAPVLKDGKICAAYVALAGRSLGSIRTTAELTLDSEMEITEDILKMLCKEATKGIPADKKVLKVLPRKYYIDNQLSQKPVGTMGTKLKGEFTVVTCNPINRRNLEKVLDDRVKLPVLEYVVTPLAVASLVLGEEEKQLGCALVDIGAQTTTVSIYKDRALQYLATLPLGSQNITHDIAIGMSITDERAELAKISQGNAIPDTQPTGDEQTRINCYVQARAAEIVANISAQITFAGFKTSDLAAGIVLTGRGSKLRNLPSLIESQLKTHARLASIPTTVNVLARNYEPTDYTSLIAIIARSARLGDMGSCVEFEETTEEIPQETENTQSNKGGYNAYSNDDNDDPYWNLDDDQAAKRRDQDLRTQQRRKEQEENKARQQQQDALLKQQEKERKEKEALQNQEEKARKKAEREERKRNKKSFLSIIGEKIKDAVTFDPSRYDSYLDDDDDKS